MEKVIFKGTDGSFCLMKADQYNGLYFPIAGKGGMKGCVTPMLAGDTKLNQNAFLMEPVSIADLHNRKSNRNFWCCTEENGCWSAVGASDECEARKFDDNQDIVKLEGSFMCQTVTRKSDKYQLKSKVTSFVPIENDVEIMQVTITNISDQSQKIKPVAAIPIYGRSADNIRDHRHVTSLLHRIETTKHGVLVKPTLSFDERGHQENVLTYYVCGATGKGESPIGFYPSIDEFIGEGGSLYNPRSLFDGENMVKEKVTVDGEEALGGICFEEINLQPGESASYQILMGIANQKDEIEKIIEEYKTEKQVIQSKKECYEYWQNKVNVKYYTGNNSFDNFLRWVSFQPMLRRIYGCSFLPHHDYGRGGRGWRDLWQDCLSLLIMDPSEVRQMIVDNYCGVRIDGTNATIIGEKQGQFIADRNGIARVWMDHGYWPFLTTKLYMDQTGDIDILSENICYFKDEQCERGTALDDMWNVAYGLKHKKQNGEIYQGTILEHILLENLCAFYEVGEHNHMKLRGADWNDALDMAEENGESVAFTCAYAGNLKELSELLLFLKEKKGWTSISVMKELEILLSVPVEKYDSADVKREVLAQYLKLCRHDISGEKADISIDALAKDLAEKSQWIMEHVRKTEWITESDSERGWFNSYYDNSKNKVEGFHENHVRMMLTGQVFAIASETATLEQTAQICQSADKYLYDGKIGGYRLNTDFHELKKDLGRMFGFAYGEKENGAVFSHMTVMYANGLYKRGFVKEGYKALQSLADTALDFDTSRILPGIPEYFNSKGKGLYHYLTGAGSWYMLTMVTQVFGIRGDMGDLVLNPKLMAQQFDEKGTAEIEMLFDEKRIKVTYINSSRKPYGEYKLLKAQCNGEELTNITLNTVKISKEKIETLDKDKVNSIVIELQ